MQTFRCVTILWALVAMMTSNAGAAPRITRMSDRKNVEFTQMVEDIKDAKVILIGETHNEKKHHEIQLEVMRTLLAKGLSLAVGLEMFSTESQPQLDLWTEGKITEQSFRRIYAENWSEEWLLYRDIFLFARNAHIPLIALNVPKRIVSKVAEQGFKSLQPKEKENLPPDVACVLNTTYTEFLRKVYTQHPTNNKIFTYFCEAQTLRNDGMAWNIVKYIREHPEKTFITLAGALHVVKNGIPEQLSHYGGALTYKVLMPELPGFPTEEATLSDADYFIGR